MLRSIYLTYLVLRIAAGLLMTTDDSPYCGTRYRRLCQGKGPHVACQYPFPGPSEYCENYQAINFTSFLKHFITNYINRRRQRLAAGHERLRGGERAPTPQIMMQVEWDRELATLAQRLADQCRFEHDDCRATVRFPYAGQTVGEVRLRKSESDELSVQRAIRRVFDAWWGERRRVEPKQLVQPFRLTHKGTVWGHFSQLAVWTLRAVGCGAVQHGPRYPRLLLVCDFSHTNMLGEKTLIPGRRAACPHHTARKQLSPYPLLCSTIRQTTTISQSKDEEYEEQISYNYTSWSTKRPKEQRDRTRKTTPRARTRNRPLLETISGRRARPKPHQSKSAEHWDESTKRSSVPDEDFSDKTENVYEATTVRRTTFEPTDEWEDSDVTLTDMQYVTDSGTRVSILSRSTTREPQSRHRWKQNRNRPRRPGADALLLRKTTTGKTKTAPALKLDVEDMEQLFHDTGYRQNWKKKPHIT